MVSKTTTKGRGRKTKLPNGITSHGDGYRARVQLDGARKVGETVATIEEAVRIRDRMRRRPRGVAVFTLDDAFDLLRADLKRKGTSADTERYYESAFRILLDAWEGSTHLERIDARAIEKFADIRRESHGVSRSTIAKNLGVLRRVFRLAIRKKRDTGIVENPIDEVGLPSFREKRSPCMTTEQVSSAVARIRSHEDVSAIWDADLVSLLFLTGLRRAEVARLRVEDVDAFKGRVLVHGKTEDVELDLSDEARDVLARLVRSATRDGFIVSGRSENTRKEVVSNTFIRWRDRLSIPDFRAHVLRHSCITAMVRAGLPLPVVQRAARHKTTAMTVRYFHESSDEIRAAFSVLSLGGVNSKPDAATGS